MDVVSVETKEREWIVTPQDIRGRLDKFLATRFPDVTRSRLVHLIDEGFVTVNRKIAERSYRVKVDDRIVLVLPPPVSTEIAPEDIPLHILFEDEEVIVINKPAGMLVHPVLHVSRGTLVNALLFHCPDLRSVEAGGRPGIVHRLDRDTSGVMVVAKTSRSKTSLMKQFRDRKVHKTYLALVYGVPKEKEGVLEDPIGRSLHNRQKMATFSKPARRGNVRIREARTRYFVKESSKEFALIEAKPETGRTHQIRVHLAHLGHPIVGDTVYTRRKAPEWAPRQMLHAKSIKFKHPGTGQTVQFEAPVPEDFKRALEFTI